MHIKKLLILIFLSCAFFANAQIVQAEYFWDTDPGQGMGNPIDADDGNLDEAVETLLSGAVGPLGSGLHTFNIRIKDNNGNWGPVFRSVISVESLDLVVDKKIIQAEYFWDTDPGVGNGTAILALDGNLDEALEVIFSAAATQPSLGLHKFNIRIKDNENTWGPVFSSVIEIQNLDLVTDKKIIQAEYFWDTDPGTGSATAILALDGNLDEAVETVFNSGVNQPAVGLHTFNIRIKDEENTWSPVFSNLVSVETLVTVLDKKIIQAEYFWDTDPGVGNGNAILAMDGGLDEAVEKVLNSSATQPSAGLHKFNIRVKDNENTWSPVFSSVVSVETLVAASDKKIVQAEFFWDTDPGVGMAYPVSAMDGTFDEALEIALTESGSTSSLSIGLHTLYVRMKDLENNWSPVFGQVVEITNCLSPEIDLGEDAVLCSGDNTTLDAGAGFDTYLWSTSATTQTISVSAPGTYSVTASDASGCIRIDTIVFLPQSYVNLGSSFNSCSGSEISIDAGTFDSYSWASGQSTQTITVSPTVSTTYSVTVSDEGGCTSSGSVFVNVFDLPAITLGADQYLCSGGSTIIDAGLYVSYEWSTGETTQTISVSATGNYSVTVTDANSCENSDMVHVEFYPLPVVDFGENTVLCSGNSVNLDAGDYITFIWNTTETTQTITVTSSGTYAVTVVDLYGCIGTGVAIVTEGEQPTVNIGNDTAFCGGNSLVLDAGSFESWDWSTGSTNQTISVSSSGTYSVTVTNTDNCTNTDEITVTVHTLPVVALGDDMPLCNGDSELLDAGSFASFVWSDMSTNQTLLVNTSGTYTVTVTDNNGCTGSDGINIWNGSPNVFLGNDTTICADDYIILDAGTGYDSYSWFNGATSSAIMLDSTGYGLGNVFCSVTVEDNGCQTTDYIVINFDICDGIASAEIGEAISVYPNPASDFVYIIAEHNAIVSILSVEGKELLITEINSNKNEINVSGFSEGTYFIKIVTDRKSLVEKLIISR